MNQSVIDIFTKGLPGIYVCESDLKRVVEEKLDNSSKRLKTDANESNEQTSDDENIAQQFETHSKNFEKLSDSDTSDSNPSDSDTSDTDSGDSTTREWKAINRERRQHFKGAKSDKLSNSELKDKEIIIDPDTFSDCGSDVDKSLTQTEKPFVELSNTSTTEEEDSDQKFKSKALRKLGPNLKCLILKGCFDNFQLKSTLIKEYSKYCAKNYPTMEMLVKRLSAFDLSAEQKLMSLLRNRCMNLKCLRLSYCKLSINLMKKLREMFLNLQCMHLEYIYGIETREEWAVVGTIFNLRLINISFNADSREIDISGMLSELRIFQKLALEEYNCDMSRLFSNVCQYLRKLSLINYYNIDRKAIKALADRCGYFLWELEMVYDNYHLKRANTSEIFSYICQHFTELRNFRFKSISETNLRPIFKLKYLKELDLLFSRPNLIDFHETHRLDLLRSLSLTNALLTPSRVDLMTKRFINLRELSLNGSLNKQYKDSPIFCCECKKIDKLNDDCSLCYQNCAMNIMGFTQLKTFKMNYVKVKSSLSTALPHFPSLLRLVINPFECRCAGSLLLAAMMIADKKHFKFIIRKCFVRNAIEEEFYITPNLEIIDYDKNVHN